MEQIRSLASQWVGRVVLLVFLGIGTVMLLFSSSPTVALKIGGSCSLLLAVALWQRSTMVRRGGSDGLHLRGLLSHGTRQAGRQARKQIDEILSLTYLRFARSTAGAASLFFAGSLLLGGIAG